MLAKPGGHTSCFINELCIALHAVTLASAWRCQWTALLLCYMKLICTLRCVSVQSPYYVISLLKAMKSCSYCDICDCSASLVGTATS